MTISSREAQRRIDEAVPQLRALGRASLEMAKPGKKSMKRGKG